MRFFYGLSDEQNAKDIVSDVVRILGNGGNDNADTLLLCTLAVESQFGTFPDRHPESLGVGAWQHDQIALDDIKQNSTEHFDVIWNEFSYQMDEIELKDLAYDPVLSCICARLSYLRIPEPIPLTLEEKARYWKEYYNTAAGKGTTEHFIESAVKWSLA